MKILLGDFVVEGTSEISCLERPPIFRPKAWNFCRCCGVVGLGAEYPARVALIDHLLDLGSPLWNPPFIAYTCHCVCNSQLHYLLIRMSDRFLARKPSFNVYRVVTGNSSTSHHDACVVLD